MTYRSTATGWFQPWYAVPYLVYVCIHVAALYFPPSVL